MFFKNKRSEGGAVGVVLIQFSKRFRPVAENGNKQRTVVRQGAIIFFNFFFHVIR
jgi:hypothetical protein